MSRWLWALLAGVVLVAIAAVFWIDETSVLPPVSRGTTPVAPAPAPASHCAERRALGSILTFAPGRAGGGSSVRSGSSARCRTASHLAARAVPRKARGSPGRRAGAFAPACSRCARRNAAAAARARTGVAGSRWHICAQEPRAAGRDLGLFRSGLRAPLPAARRRAGPIGSRWTSSPRPRLSSRPKKILLPSAICRIDGAREAEGMLKVSADCEDSISFTPRSVMIALRSTTELVYSASGDAALATTLKKCAP